VPEVDVVIAIAGELFVRYARAVAKHGWPVAVTASVLLLNVPRFRLSLRAERWVRLGFLSAVVVAGSAYAWSLIWASDDAYISFRYAENLALGRGLVWNAGERVEGYTDFLWTVVIAAFIRAGADPGHAGILLSLLSFAVVMVTAARFPGRLTGQRLLFGPAPLLCALHYTTASFATAGLETMFGAMLTLLAVERAETGRPLAAGTAAILATMAHPDHAIFYAALGAAHALDRRRRRDMVRYAVPFVFLFVPYFLWRWSYYGDLMPNTYYAKSAGHAYFQQGTIYFLATFIGGGLVFAMPLAVAGAYGIRKTVTGRFAWIGLPLYVVYVAKIGGDFMFGRLFVPVLVFTFVLADVGFRSLLAKDLRLIAATLVTVAALPSLPIGILKPGEIFQGIADERSFTPITDFPKMISAAWGYTLGQAIERHLNWPGRKPLVGLHNIGMAGYYGKVPVFDLRGLTSRSVAHLPIKARGRPGHEKLASPGHAVEAGVALSQEPVYPPPYDSLTRVEFDGFHFFLVQHQPRLVRNLTSRGARLVRSERLDGLLADASKNTPQSIQCHLWFLREYYFASNTDPARRERITKAIASVDPDSSSLESVILEPRSPSSLGFAPVRSISPEPRARDWTSSGDASHWRHEPLLPDQGLTIGRTGPVVFTSTDSDVDDSVGSIVSEPFTVEGDVITFPIAGGMDMHSLTVSLVIDGKPVRSATGCRSEWLGTRAWDVKPFRGARANVVVTDASRNAWGHLVVGTITEWRGPS
jgi:hypothetical protein